MTEPAAPRPTTTTLPPPTANGSAPPLPPPPAVPPADQRRRLQTRISGTRSGLIAAGTARITQLRRIMRRDRRKPQAS